MIWEQTIKLTRPLRAVRLEVNDESADETRISQTVDQEEVSTAMPHTDPASQGTPRDTEPNTNRLLETLVELLRARQAAAHQATCELQVIAVEVATAVAERLFLTQTANGELELERLVNEALSVLEPSGPVVVRLHPDDVTCLQDATLAIPTGEIELVADASMDRGNCQVGGGSFGVRYDWAVQLQELRRRMLQGLMDAHADN